MKPPAITVHLAQGALGADFELPDGAAASDADIRRTARLWLDRHGAQAVLEARGRAGTLRRAGDIAGADAWLRLIVAIEEMTRWHGG